MNLGTHKVVMYDSIEELPIVRFQKYNKMLMLDAGLGSDVTALDGHLARVSEYIKAGDLTNAAGEIDNLRQTLFNVQNGLTPHFMSLIPLMAEVDGEPLTDLSDENLQRVYDRLKDVTMKAYEGAASEVKKKSRRSLKPTSTKGARARRARNTTS